LVSELIGMIDACVSCSKVSRDRVHCEAIVLVHVDQLL